MIDEPELDEPISKRRSKRSCRLSIVKSQPSIEQKEAEPITDENDEIEEEEEDPADLFQAGDIFWVRVPGNPWWPALIYGSFYEDYVHTRVVKTPHRPKKRRYFVYFFGPDFEYIWSDANTLIPFSGLEDFIRQAEMNVQKVPSSSSIVFSILISIGNKKNEQEILANRFELKVPASKRAQWDKAIEEADRASQLTREQRQENFAEILKTILHHSEEKKRSSISTKKSSKRSSVKRQKTKSTPVSTSTTLLHVGLPILTKKEESEIVNSLLEHEQLSLHEAQSLACQLVLKIVKENFQFEMSCVQIEWFYDFLLNHSEILSKHSHWFNEDIKPIFDDSITFKQNQLRNLLLKK